MNKIINNRMTHDESLDDQLTTTLKGMMEKGIEITPYMIVKAKIKLGITPSGKELSEMASYFSDCVDEHNRNNNES